MKLSLAHLKSDYVGSSAPWEIEKERKEEKKRVEGEKKRKEMEGWMRGGKTVGGVGGQGVMGNAKSEFFKSRKAHPGGQISSNKMEATFKFLKKKEARGEVLTPNELSIIEKFVGVDPADLATLDEKAKLEKKERDKKQKKQGAAGGGGANKDCREIQLVKTRKKGKAVEVKKKGKGGGKWKQKEVVKNKKQEPKAKFGKARSQSVEDMLNGALGSRR